MEEAILSLEKGAMERWRQGDPWGWAEISAEDVIYVDPGRTKPIVGMEEYRAFLQEIAGKVHYQGSEFINPRVVIIGEAALLTYNYRSSVLDEAGAVLRQTPWNTTEVYFRRDGQWKIVHSHWSYVQHSAPASVEIPLPVHTSPQEYEGVLGEVMELESAAMERYDHGDPWGFTDLSAEDVTYFDTTTVVRVNGLEALKALYKEREGKIFCPVIDFIDPQIRVFGDMAVLVYRFLSTRLNPDGTVSHRTPWNCSEVFRRTGGNWRIIHTHWSYILGEKA
ncbi:MAG: nuclear transport factor 2 family protein [Anaerolineales bacterium]|nr:nuclear transport factor 2 family protein [Anaerolineales bacterium]